jgi:hypothetical protein
MSKLVLSLDLGWSLLSLLPSLLSYLDVKTRRKLSALSCDKTLVGINKIPVNTASAEIQGFYITGI